MATYKSNNSNFSPSWSYSDQQQSQVGSTLSGYSKLFGIAGSIYAAGHIPIGDKKLFDYYSQGLRYFEEYTPGRIGRTLQLSTFMSPFESSSRAYKFFSPSNIREFHPNQLAQLQELGINIYGTELRDKGFRYEKGKFLLGQSDSKVLLEHASIYRSPMGATPHFQEGYIRSLFGSKSDTAFLSQSGKDTLRSSLITKTPYTTATGETANEMMMFAGGKTRLQSAGRFLGGVGTSWIERYNRLLTGVTELLPENKIIHKVGKLLSVKPGPGLQTLGKLSLKLGVGIPTALMAYDLLDWGVRKFPLFNGTILDEGITAAGLSLYQRTQIGISKGADLLGLHSLREAQENAAPGSTSLLKLSAFPITGAIAAATYGYARRAVKMAAFQKGGFSLSDASLMASAEKYVMEKQLYGTALPEELTRIMPADLIGMVEGQTANTLQGLRGRFAKRIVEQQGKKGLLGSLLNKLGKVSPGKINTVIGAGIGLGLVLPFLPGALIPSDRPEKLERIYSGEELVPIRKGRWWELNSSPYEGEREIARVPHWTVRHMTQARDIAIYGGDYPEIYDWYKRNFTYDIERENYYSRPYGMCLHPNVLVFTDKGDKFIKDINIGDKVINSDGKWTEVIGLSNRECYEKELFEFKFASDNRILLTTEDHPILAVRNNYKQYEKRGDRCRNKQQIINNNPLEWVRAKDLQKSDLVVVPINQNEIESSTLDLIDFTNKYCFHEDKIIYDSRVKQELVDAYYSNLSIIEGTKKYSVDYRQLWDLRKKGGWKRTISRYVQIDKEFALFIGLFLAEGWIESNLQRIGFAFHKEEENTYVRFIQEYVSKNFKATSKVEYPSDNGIQLNVYSKHLGIILSSIFGIKKAPKKDIPNFIFNLPKKLKQEVIKGLIRGDGCTEKIHEISFCSASSLLTIQLRLLLLSIGIKSSIKKQIPQSTWKIALIRGREIKKGISYHLTISGSDYNLFASFEEEVDYFSNYPDRKGLIQDNYLYIPIRKINKVPYSGLVYDITVKEGESFLTSCIVHNSSPAFSEVPIIGPLLGATLGKIIKPPRMMHTEETDVFGSNGEVVDSPLRYGQTPMIPEAGEMASDKPISPYGITPVVSDMAYNLRELIGLPGWLLSVVNNEATGSQGLFDQATRYQTAGDIYSTRREYWEQEYGSLLGASELYRRLYPKKQGYEEWNAIPNAFSNVSWLPGAGEKSENFTVGDPYTKVPLGEFRLPGPAFEELHPELKGLSPNEYPLRYQLQILGDVAPYSDKYRMVKSQVSAAIKRNELSDYEIAKVGETLKQVEEKKQRKVFTDSPPSRAQVQQQLAGINNAQQQTPSEPSWLGSVLGGYWNTLSHNIETPLEQLTPISPGAKLVHMRTATEDYAKEQLYGTSFANWATPMKSFINPFLAGTAHAMGSENVPPDVQQRRDIESYFDAMQYLKYTAMKRSAQEQGDTTSIAAFEQARRKTMVGANYYSPNPTNIMKALPRSERDYFTAFSNTTDPIEQQKILSMVPDTSKAMYQARWDLRNATQQQKANKADNVSNNIAAQQVSLLQRDEGFTRTSDLESEYNSSKIASESFPDWYRRTKLVPQVIRNRKLPGPDWVGWNPITMMDDVKLKVVENLGESPFQYDIWQEQQRAARRKQYLDTAAQQLNYENLPQVSTGELQNGITQLLTNHDIYNPRVQVMQLASASKNSVNMEITQDREKEIKEIIRKRGLL